jgi:hypothetical protein
MPISRKNTPVPTPSEGASKLSPRDAALTLLIEQAQISLQNGDLSRSDELIGQVLAAEEPPGYRINHDTRMDCWRVLIAFVMILGLFGIVAAVAFKGSASASPYVSIMSGLAGIALGWLFGSGTTTSTGNRGSGSSSIRRGT